LFTRFRFQLVAKGEGGIAAGQRRGAKTVINAPLRAEVDLDDVGLQVFEFLGKCPFQVLPRPFCLTYCAK